MDPQARRKQARGMVTAWSKVNEGYSEFEDPQEMKKEIKNEYPEARSKEKRKTILTQNFSLIVNLLIISNIC
jgi:hypothetical protein